MADEWMGSADELGRWADGRDGGIDAYGVRLLLDLVREEPGVGRPAELTPARLRRMMLETFPETVVAEAEDMPSVMATARALVDYLAETGRIAAGQADALRAGLTALEPELTKIIVELDEAERETADEVVRGMMRADGVALDDEQAVRSWLGEFESLSDEERFDRAAAYLRETEEMTVPPVVVAPEAELAAAARASGLTRQIVALAGWTGERAVTAGEELLPADAVPAATAVGIAGAGAESMADLPELERLWWAAAESGVLVVEHGRAAPGPVLKDLREGDDTSVLAAWARVFGQAVVGETGAVDETDIRLLVRAELTGVLLHLYEQEQPATREELGAALAGHLMDTALDHGHAPDPGEVVTILDRELEEFVAWGVVQSEGDGLVLTPLGVWGVRELLLAEGFRAPLVGELAGRSATELIEGLAWHRDETAMLETDHWLTARSAKAAATELIEAMRTGSPGVRCVASAILTGVADEAAPVVRRALDEPGTRPYARLWLHESGDEEVEPQVEDMAWILADTVAAMLEADEPGEEVTAALAEVSADAGPDGLRTLVESIGRVGHPQAPEVLAALAEHLTDPALAGAARAEAARTGAS